MWVAGRVKATDTDPAGCDTCRRTRMILPVRAFEAEPDLLSDLLSSAGYTRCLEQEKDGLRENGHRLLAWLPIL